MFKLQSQLNKRLATLKQNNQTVESKVELLNPAQIKAALIESGIISKSGKIRTFQSQ